MNMMTVFRKILKYNKFHKINMEFKGISVLKAGQNS